MQHDEIQEGAARLDFEKAKKRFLPMSETMFYILLSLRGKERHGYGIMLHVREITGGRISLGAGTVYQSLSKLQEDGLIRAAGGENRKKLYAITALGGEILKAEAERIKELYLNSEDLR